MYEDLLNDKCEDGHDGFVKRNPKLNHESAIYDNFYKRVFIDILCERKFPATDSSQQ